MEGLYMGTHYSCPCHYPSSGIIRHRDRHISVLLPVCQKSLPQDRKENRMWKNKAEFLPETLMSYSLGCPSKFAIVYLVGWQPLTHNCHLTVVVEQHWTICIVLKMVDYQIVILFLLQKGVVIIHPLMFFGRSFFSK